MASVRRQPPSPISRPPRVGPITAMVWVEIASAVRMAAGLSRPGCCPSSGTRSGQPSGNAPVWPGTSVRPGGVPATLTSTTGRSWARNASASARDRSTIVAVEWASGTATMPACRSMTISAVVGSSVVMGTAVSVQKGMGIGHRRAPPLGGRRSRSRSVGAPRRAPAGAGGTAFGYGERARRSSSLRQRARSVCSAGVSSRCAAASSQSA